MNVTISIDGAFLSTCAMALVVCLGVSWLINQSPIGRDDTDQPGWFGQRSGVKPVTDHRTGLQYLITKDGGITPRLRRDGRHLRAGEEA